jgi:predicted GIY-YIG superfamily endonuclease
MSESKNTIVEAALSAYADVRIRFGKPPTSREFYQYFSTRELSKAFQGGNAYSTLQELAGDEANRFSSLKSELDTILFRWGTLARKTLSEHGKLPVQSDWAHHQLSPSVSGIEKSHHIKWSAMPGLFREQFSSNTDWQDVVIAIPKVQEEIVPSQRNDECFVYLMKDLRNGRHKIGISNSPKTRERTLQSEQPKTELLAYKKFVNRRIAAAFEKALHETYSHKRQRGEWFVLDNEEVAEILATLDEGNG